MVYCRIIPMSSWWIFLQDIFLCLVYQQEKTMVDVVEVTCLTTFICHALKCFECEIVHKEHTCTAIGMLYKQSYYDPVQCTTLEYTSLDNNLSNCVELPT
jgi:hypothetical protein